MAGHDQSDEEFIAAAIEQDLRASVAAFGDEVTITSDLEEFVGRIKAAEREHERRRADPRSSNQIRDELGQMLQRFYEALWYGTPEQVRQVVTEIGPVFSSDADRVAVWPPAVAVGAFIRAVGYNPYDGEPDSVSGIVEEATYTEHPSHSWPYERRSGVNFALTQPPRAGVEEEGICDYVFVPEEDRVICLPAPVDRGRPAWLEQPTTTKADLGATDAPDPAARQAATSAGPPGAHGDSPPSATGPATPTTIARLSFPTPATPAVAPPPRPAGPAGTPRPRGHGRHR